jgi:hypothetical protein
MRQNPIVEELMKNRNINEKEAIKILTLAQERVALDDAEPEDVLRDIGVSSDYVEDLV